MEPLVAYLAGIVLLSLIGHLLLPPLLRVSAKEPPRPDGVDEKVWDRLTKGANGGSWLGLLERTLFYVGFASSIEMLIAGWLAFKLASKWEVWKNVIRVPEAPSGTDGLKMLAWTHDYGSWILQRFWIGALTNILLAFGAAMGSQYIYHSL